MPPKIVDIRCTGCGNVMDISQKICKYCKTPVTISTFNSVFEMPMPLVNEFASAYRQALGENPYDQTLNNSVAMCYLKLKLYDKALAAFEKAMEDNFDNTETYFYAAICLLKGKKAFLASHDTIDKIEEYLNAAMAIEPRGIYSYLQAYIKNDFYARKHLITEPDWRQAMANAKLAGYSPFDVEELFRILGVSKPDDFTD